MRYDRRRMGRLIRKRRRLEKSLVENGQRIAVLKEQIARLELLIQQAVRPSPD